MEKKEDLLGEIAEAVNGYTKSERDVKEIIQKAQKKRPKKLALQLSLIIITITATSFLYSNQRTLAQQNQALRASHVLYNDVSPNPICKDVLIVTLNGHPVCPI